MKIIHTSQKGIDLIKKYEGFKPKPYLCPANVPTIGYGTIRYPNGVKVTLNDKPITEIEAEGFLKAYLINDERLVDAMTTDLVNQNQFDALISFAYNLGINALRGSTLLKKVNANSNDTTIKNEFMKWVNAGGKRLQGLVNRRTEETILYFS